MRLVVTALISGLCGAFVYGAIARRDAPPAVAPAFDVAPLTAALQELQQTVRNATFAADAAPPPPRTRIVEAAPAPASTTTANVDLDAAVARFAAAVEACSERLEQLAIQDRGQELLAEMVRETARLPVTSPPRWDALQSLVALGDDAIRGVGFLTPAEVLQRFGGPTRTRIEESQMVWWYWGAESYVKLYFFAGHVVSVDADRR
jgi:hypothetical protein